MAYSNTWSDTRPLGSAQASTADDEMRTIRLDVHQRMDDLVEDWTADPVVLKQGIIGTKTGKVLIFGPHIMANREDEDDTGHQDAFVDTDDDGASVVGSFFMPVGVTITKIEALMEFHDGASECTTEVFTIAFDASVTKSVIATLTRTDNGPGVETLASLTHLVGEDKVYGVRFYANSGGRGRFYGLKITYDTPDSRNTV